MTARDSLLPRVRDGAVDGTDAIERSLTTPRMTIVLARDGQEKARLLATLPQWPAPSPAAPLGERVAAERRELLAALRGPYAARSNGNHGSPTRTPLVLRAQDLGVSADAVAALADRLSAAGAGASAIPHAVEALEAAAAALLADDGGPIAQLTARVRHLDDALEALRADEAVEQAQLEALLTAGAVAPEIERERDRLLAERDHWQTLIRLWPDWQGLQEARREFKALAKFERLPGDLDARVGVVNEHCQRAEAGVRAARRRLTELQGARQAKPSRRERGLDQHATEALRLHDALPAYRSRLLELGAMRARLAELERTLGAHLEGLGETEVMRLVEQLTRERRIALRRWRERVQLARAASTAAEQRLSSARERLRTLSAEVHEALAKECSDGDADVDVRWRSLWHLRAHLEEIWEVQSRAEAKARTLRDREDTLRRVAAARYWRPGRWLRLTLNAVILGVALGAFGAGLLQGQAYGLPLAVLTAVLSLLAFVLHARTRWVGVLERRRATRLHQLRAETDRLRRDCDDDWRRAARLTELMRLAAQRLSLPESVTPELVEASEQELAAHLREHGAESDLTGLLLALLDAQEEEPRCAAILAEVEAERAGLEREWEAWRAEAGLPPDLDVERADEWMRGLSELAAASAARSTARDELAAIEPMIGAWEQDARRLLGRVGKPVSAELCGSALAAELSALVARVHAEEADRRREARLDVELHEAEQGLRDAETELERARSARQAVIHASRAGDEAGLHAQLEGLRRWRAVRERIAGLERAIETGVQGLASPAEARARLARGEIELWGATLRDIEAQREQQRAALERIAERRRTAERRIAAAAEATGASDLLQEREQVLAELRESAREWQLRVLAASLVAAALEEQNGVEKSELLQHASRHLAAFSGGRFTAIVRAEQPAALALVDRGGGRVALDARLGQDAARARPSEPGAGAGHATRRPRRNGADRTRRRTLNAARRRGAPRRTRNRAHGQRPPGAVLHRPGQSRPAAERHRGRRRRISTPGSGSGPSSRQRAFSPPRTQRTRRHRRGTCDWPRRVGLIGRRAATGARPVACLPLCDPSATLCVLCGERPLAGTGKDPSHYPRRGIQRGTVVQ